MNKKIFSITVFAVLFVLVHSQRHKMEVSSNRRLNQEDDRPIVREELALLQRVSGEIPQPKITQTIVMPILWVIIILSILFSGYMSNTPSRTRITTWWEFLIFAFLYFNLAGMLSMFVPESLKDTDKTNQWAVNGGTGGGIAFATVVILCSLYAKALKVHYGYHGDKPKWRIIRIVALASVMMVGFACGAVVITLGLNASSVTADQWLYAYGVIVLIYAALLPLLCFFVYICGLNFYQKIEVQTRTSSSRKEKPVQDGKSHRGRSHRIAQKPATPTSELESKTSDTQYVPPGGRQWYRKTPAQGDLGPVVGPTSSQQSTGSNYYKLLMGEGKGAQVKSISQYEHIRGPSPVEPKAPTARPPSVVAASGPQSLVAGSRTPATAPISVPPSVASASDIKTAKPEPKRPSGAPASGLHIVESAARPPSAAPASKPPSTVAASRPSTAPASSMKVNPSQQSTGTGYYRLLMQGDGNTPKVKSISEYGHLLGGGPK